MYTYVRDKIEFKEVLWLLLFRRFRLKPALSDSHYRSDGTQVTALFEEVVMKGVWWIGLLTLVSGVASMGIDYFIQASLILHLWTAFVSFRFAFWAMLVTSKRVDYEKFVGHLGSIPTAIAGMFSIVLFCLSIFGAIDGVRILL